MPKWTSGCTRHEVRAAIEVKHLMRALGGPKEYLGATKKNPEKGSLGALRYSWGLPRALMRCLTSIATLTPCLVQSPFQLGKFTNFWSLPI